MNANSSYHVEYKQLIKGKNQAIFNIKSAKIVKVLRPDFLDINLNEAWENQPKIKRKSTRNKKPELLVDVDILSHYVNMRHQNTTHKTPEREIK